MGHVLLNRREQVEKMPLATCMLRLSELCHAYKWEGWCAAG